MSLALFIGCFSDRHTGHRHSQSKGSHQNHDQPRQQPYPFSARFIREVSNDWTEDDSDQGTLRQQGETKPLRIGGVQGETGFDDVRQDGNDKGVEEGVYPSFISIELVLA